jgi:hypothetical protein
MRTAFNSYEPTPIPSTLITERKDLILITPGPIPSLAKLVIEYMIMKNAAPMIITSANIWQEEKMEMSLTLTRGIRMTASINPRAH